MVDWEKRYHEAEEAFQILKTLTKEVPASSWSPEYRKLAEAIHTLGRDRFYVQSGERS